MKETHLKERRGFIKGWGGHGEGPPRIKQLESLLYKLYSTEQNNKWLHEESS
jgi:hypothetical protein